MNDNKMNQVFCAVMGGVLLPALALATGGPVPLRSQCLLKTDISYELAHDKDVMDNLELVDQTGDGRNLFGEQINGGFIARVWVTVSGAEQASGSGLGLGDLRIKYEVLQDGNKAFEAVSVLTNVVLYGLDQPFESLTAYTPFRTPELDYVGSVTCSFAKK